MSISEFFPFGVWQSNDDRKRWWFEFNKNGVIWRERNAAGQNLERIVPLKKIGSSWRIERPNTADVLAFLGANASVASELLQRSPASSFIQIDLIDQPEAMTAHWNGLFWTLDPHGHVNRMDQPGTTPQTRKDYTCPRQGNDAAYYAVPRGQLTFDAEGAERGPFHSRFLHWPGGASGVTIGRGYDMKERTSSEVKTDLLGAGVDDSLASLCTPAAGLSGPAAQQFANTNRAQVGNITPGQQQKLFSTVYTLMSDDVKRISQKADVVNKYGSVNFDTLSGTILDVVVDLRFRGDYTPQARELIQKHMVDNDLANFSKKIKDAANWPNVPSDRQQRRKTFLEQHGG